MKLVKAGRDLRDHRRRHRTLRSTSSSRRPASTSSKQTLLTISVTEDEILGIGGENIAGAFACMKYFQSLDNPNNKKFVAAFKETYGDKSVIGDVTQAAYLGPWLWKLTAEKAGSFDIDKIAAASPGRRVQGRAGRLRSYPREPPSLEQDPRRQSTGQWSVRTGLRNRRSRRAQSIPQRLPIRR